MYTKLSEMTGTRPKVYNLKDSDYLKDKEIMISKIDIKEGGEFGVFVVLTCKVKSASGVFDEDVVITTGASDIVTRLVPLADKISPTNQATAELHKIGRKWLID